MSGRRSERKRADEVVMVHDAMTGATLGRLGNLSRNGLMLIGNEAIGEACLLQVQFHLLDGRSARQAFELGVQCMWSSPAQADRSHWSGCRIIDISVAEQAWLNRWLQAPA